MISFYPTTGDERWTTIEVLVPTEDEARDKVRDLEADGCRVLGVKSVSAEYLVRGIVTLPRPHLLWNVEQLDLKRTRSR